MKESFIITKVSREDLEALGFNTSKVSDKTMERLASKLADDYCEQLFWTSLEILAECMGIPKRKRSSMPKLYMLTLEWYDGELLKSNLPKYHVHAYPGITQKQHDEILTDMELHSPYEHTNEEVFTNKKEFENKLEYLKSKGVILND